jgi:hypothetical protein
MLPENQDIRETYFQQEHLQQFRAMGGHLRQLLDEFIDRVPKPEPIVLEPELTLAFPKEVHAEGDSAALLVMQLDFTVTNTSSRTARLWDVPFELHHPSATFSDRYRGFPPQPSHAAILPKQGGRKSGSFGFRIQKHRPCVLQLRDILFQTVVRYHTVSEDHLGEPRETPIGEVVDPNEFAQMVRTWLVNQLSWPAP